MVESDVAEWCERSMEHGGRGVAIDQSQDPNILTISSDGLQHDVHTG